MGKLITLFSSFFLLSFGGIWFTYAALFPPPGAFSLPPRIIFTILALLFWFMFLKVMLWENLPKRTRERVEIWWFRMKGDL